MITIENTYNSAKVYAESLDSGTEGLIRALCGNPLSKGSRIRIMPDVHAGKGCAVGTTMTIQDCVAPGLVGVDIGCGMLAVRFRAKRLELQKLDKLIQDSIPSGRNIRSTPHHFAEQADLERLHCLRHIQKDKALCAVGTLGGGNHFIEVDKAEDGTFWLIVHSGSRRLGVEVASFYQNEAFHQCPDGTPFELSYVTGSLMDKYLHDMAITQAFAELNRRAIADDIIKGMKLNVEEIISTIHNYIDLDSMILRKGAVSAKEGERLIIPMNMRDGCLLCVGKGNPDWNESAPHGAGRRMSRADARNSFTLSQYRKEMKGIYTTSVNRNTLDESPMAYKPLEAIVRQIEPTVTTLERIRPIYNFKSGEEVKA
ncbi:MAG: RtcB family protein [Anaerovoracaceae bacterium]